MTGFELLLGHLIGDYILQNDWQAQNKTKSTWPCLVHCVLYTCAVAFCAPWLSPEALGLVFVTHFLMDRWRLAAAWMDLVGQRGFKEHLAPWSVIVVDNTWHLATLYAVARWL